MVGGDGLCFFSFLFFFSTMGCGCKWLWLVREVAMAVVFYYLMVDLD